MSLKQYRVIREASPDDLEREVNEALGCGWSVAGGVSVTAFHYETRDGGSTYDFLYAQALTKPLNT